MKCRECTFMERIEGELYQCTNHDSINYMEYTGVCCEDECNDGKYLVPQEHDSKEDKR